jgi:hypothetical protein
LNETLLSSQKRAYKRERGVLRRSLWSGWNGYDTRGGVINWSFHDSTHKRPKKSTVDQRVEETFFTYRSIQKNYGSPQKRWYNFFILTGYILEIMGRMAPPLCS